VGPNSTVIRSDEQPPISSTLYHTANVLVQQYGPEDVLLMAAKRTDALRHTWASAGTTRRD
jgi:hypothetical protein